MDGFFIIGVIAALITLGGLIYTVFYGIGKLFLVLVYNLYTPDKAKFHHGDEFIRVIHQILSSRFGYYKKLPESARPVFANRVRDFINSKKFTGKEGLSITDEIKVLISAAAVQLTFGLDKYRFDSFSNIFVFPGKFFSRHNKRYHKGETNLAGAITFSWDDFKKGYATEDDNYNLGLHEMAHALRFDKFRNDEFDRFFNAYFDKWMSVGKPEFLRLKEGMESPIREYGGANPEEFFAVCVEYFFESPVLMKEKLPDLFRHMCILLNQDPSMPFIPHVRKTLFRKSEALTGKLIISTSISHKKILASFVTGILFQSILIGSILMDPNTGFTGEAASVFLVAYVSLGGFFVSRKFIRFNIYENCFEAEYRLNPLLSNRLWGYENIISLSLRGRPESGSTGEVTFTFTDGIQVRSTGFSTGGIPAGEMESLVRFLKSKNIVIRVFNS